MEQIAALRERIRAATVQVPWIPAVQKDTRTRNTHSSTAIEGNPLTLLADLKQRGLLDETLVIGASEFGRTPLMQGDQGRQHNSARFTIWMGGGGVKPGTGIGANDDIGLMAVDRPMHVRDLHATIVAALGICQDDLYFMTNGRQERLTRIAGGANVIESVLA